MASFGDFVIARTGIMSSQMALNITGQNISNINTTGYTRRSLDQTTFVLNGSGLYRSNNSFSAGAGVMMNGISQLRDPYLDIRFRDEMSNVGSADALLGGLEQIQQVINDVNKNGITTQFQDLLDKFGKLNSNNIGTAEFDNLIKNSAQSLCQLLNQAASKLQDVKENYEMKYNEEVGNLNDLIDNIRNINEQIRKADINGDLALELRDQRNVMLDELSQYMKVDITYGKESLGSGIEIEKLTINVVDDSTGKSKYTLIDGINSADITINDDYSLNLSEVKDKNGNIVETPKLGADGKPEIDANTGKVIMVTQFPNGDIGNVSIEDDPNTQQNESSIVGYGALESMRQILTGKGEYADVNNGEDTAHGIPYYQESLNQLAKTFAEKMNELNTKDAQGNDLYDALNPNNPNNINGAGNLFAPNDGTTDITAANIDISDDWRNGKVNIVASTDPKAPSTANDNILRFQALFSQNIKYEGAQTGSVVYNGTFEGFYANMQGVLGLDYQSTAAVYDTYAMSADELNNSRDAVSGVDLNEEGVNMIQYQKAFAASCRMMTALDEVMDKVINGMGVVGR